MKTLALISIILSLLGWVALAVLPSHLPWISFQIAFAWFFIWIGIGTVLLIVDGNR